MGARATREFHQPIVCRVRSSFVMYLHDLLLVELPLLRELTELWHVLQ